MPSHTYLPFDQFTSLCFPPFPPSSYFLKLLLFLFLGSRKFNGWWPLDRLHAAVADKGIVGFGWSTNVLVIVLVISYDLAGCGSRRRAVTGWIFFG